MCGLYVGVTGPLASYFRALGVTGLGLLRVLIRLVVDRSAEQIVRKGRVVLRMPTVSRRNHTAFEVVRGTVREPPQSPRDTARDAGVWRVGVCTRR